MPRIEEYSQRSDVMGAMSAPGRKADPGGVSIAGGLDAVARGLENVGEVIARKQARDELTGFQKRKVEADEELRARYEERRAQLSSNLDPSSDEYSNFQRETMEDLDNTYAALGENLSSPQARNYFNESLVGMRGHFFKNVAADKSQIAAAATVSAYEASLKSASASVLSDPSSFETFRSNAYSYLDAQIKAGAIDQKIGLKLAEDAETKLAQTAVQGLIEINPDLATEELNSGKWDKFLGGEGKQKALTEIEREKKLLKLQNEKAEAEQKKAKKEATELTYTKFVDAMADGKLTIEDVKSSELSGKDREHFYRAIKAENRRISKGVGKFVSNPNVRQEFLDRIYLPDGDPNKIESVSQLMSINDGRVSMTDMKWLVGRLDKLKTEEGREEAEVMNRVGQWAKDAINHGGKDPKSAELYYQFQRQFNQYIESGRKNGKTLNELTSTEAVQKMIQPYLRSPQKKLEDRVKQERKYKEKIQKKQGGASKSERMKYIDELLKKKGLN